MVINIKNKDIRFYLVGNKERGHTLEIIIREPSNDNIKSVILIEINESELKQLQEIIK